MTTAVAAPPAASSGGEDISQRGFARALAAVTLVLLASRIEVAQGVTLGHAAALALLPMWWPALRHYRGARAVLGVGVVTLLGGLVLVSSASVDHSVSRGVLVQSVAVALTLLLGVGVVVWARTLLKDWQVGLVFGLGLLLAVSPGEGQYDVNPWKFGFALPVAVLVLSLAARRGRRVMEALVLVALAAASAVNDARSGFAVLALAAVITLSESGRLRRGARRSPLLMVLVVLGLGFAVYNVGLSLVLEGALGEETQQRSLEQVEASGSIVLGARPELAATVGLMVERPWGLGPGVAANQSEVIAAKTGMAAINYDPNNGYVEEYMFGPRTTVHSVFGDLWVLFGIPGLVLSGLVLHLLVRNLATGIAAKTASGLLVYTSCLSLWNFFFGPLSTSAAVLALAVGLGLQRLTDQDQDRGPLPPIQVRRPGAVSTAP